MKKLTVLFLSVMTLGLSVSSCSSDDDKGIGSVEGKWEISQAGMVLNGKEMLENVESENGCPKEAFEFSAGGALTSTYSEYYNSKCNNETETGTWSQSGNTLTIKYTGSDEEKYEIAEANGSRLKLKQTYSEAGISVTAVLVFVKK